MKRDIIFIVIIIVMFVLAGASIKIYQQRKCAVQLGISNETASKQIEE